MNSLEYMVEHATIRLLKERVDGVLWLPFEHEVVDNDSAPIGIVTLRRGAPGAECFHRCDLVLHVVGAADALHRQIDEAVGDRYAFADDLEREEGGIAIRNIVGWSVDRAAENNLYSRTWSNEIEVAYQQQ